MRIVSYNIHKGFGVGNRRFVLSRIRDAIQGVSADLVFLQEVLGRHDEHAKNVAGWPLESQFEFLADEVWPHFAYGKNAVYQNGHHGNAILSKFPILRWENLDISTNAFEKRGCLHAVVSPPGFPRPLHAVCVHFDLRHRGRVRQTEAVCARLRDVVPPGDPFVLAGDFNDWGRRLSATLARETGATEVFRSVTGSYARTFPSRLPVLQLDRIYVRGLRATETTVCTGGIWSALSDHAALLADLTPCPLPGA